MDLQYLLDTLFARFIVIFVVGRSVLGILLIALFLLLCLLLHVHLNKRLGTLSDLFLWDHERLCLHDEEPPGLSARKCC